MFVKMDEDFSPITAVYCSMCSAVMGSEKAQQSSKHFMQSPILFLELLDLLM